MYQGERTSLAAATRCRDALRQMPSTPGPVLALFDGLLAMAPEPAELTRYALELAAAAGVDELEARRLLELELAPVLELVATVEDDDVEVRSVVVRGQPQHAL